MHKYVFRGYDIVGKKGWVYGDLVHNMKVVNSPKGVEPRTMVGGYEVSPDSVGLFTGIKDMDGNDVYEGDIVAFADEKGKPMTNTYQRCVQLRNGGFRLVATRPNGSEDVCDIITNWDIIVIGNIYENKI